MYTLWVYIYIYIHCRSNQCTFDMMDISIQSTCQSASYICVFVHIDIFSPYAEQLCVHGRS